MNTYSNLKLLELIEVKDCIKDNKCRKAHKHSQLNTAATDLPQSSVTSQLAASSLQSGKLFCALYYQHLRIYVYMQMDLCDSFTPTFYSFLQDWTTGKARIIKSYVKRVFGFFTLEQYYRNTQHTAKL